MFKARTVAVIAGVMIGLSSGSAYAQSSVSLVDLMLNTFDQNLILAKTPTGVGVVAHTAVFSDAIFDQTRTLVTNVSQQIGSQISNFPLGSSSGGFTYSYDASLGTFSRSTQTFGPAFAERAATNGKGKFSFGFNYLHNSYNTLDGKDLTNGDIKFDLLHQPIGNYVEGDVIEAALSMDLKSDTAAFLFSYGVNDRLDIGLAVPVVHVSMDLTYHATILDFSTHATVPPPHRFANGTKTDDFSASGSASGIGDVVVRGKYAVFRNGPQGLAVGIDLRLPTGDDQNMLGSGTAQTKIFLIGSSAIGDKIAPHVNIGFTASGNSATVSNQVNYVGGVEYGLSPKVTIVGDIIGQTLTSTLQLQDALLPHSFRDGPSGPIQSTTLQTISEKTGSLTTALGTIGVKANPWRNFLISAHVLFPLNQSGLRSGITPVIGFDYAF